MVCKYFSCPLYIALLDIPGLIFYDNKSNGTNFTTGLWTRSRTNLNKHGKKVMISSAECQLYSKFYQLRVFSSIRRRSEILLLIFIPQHVVVIADLLSGNSWVKIRWLDDDLLFHVRI